MKRTYQMMLTVTVDESKAQYQVTATSIENALYAAVDSLDEVTFSLAEDVSEVTYPKHRPRFEPPAHRKATTYPKRKEQQ